MLPTIADGEVLHVEPVIPHKLKAGDIVLFRKDGEFKAHRILRKKGEFFITRGDAGMHTDGEVNGQEIVGRVVAKECLASGRVIALAGIAARARFLLDEARRRMPRRFLAFCALCCLVPASLHAQIVVSGTPTTATAQTTGTGAGVTFATIPNYVTPAGTNRLMIVGVSISTQGNAGSSITSITYGSQPLTQIASASTEANLLRVEMWQLSSPTVGTATITITGTKSGGNGNKLGVVAGVITLTGVELTSPIRSSSANTSTLVTPACTTGTACVAVSSSPTDFVLDTLAIAGGMTATTPAAQTSAWNVASGGGGQDVKGVASYRTGTAGTVTMSETTTATAWTIGAISIKAFQADMSITKTGTPDPVLQGANVTYTLTVTNNGPENATNVTVLDTLPTQVTYVANSATSTQGTCSSVGSAISCSVGAMNSGAVVTVTIVATANTPSLATNTGVVFALTPDADLVNNTATFDSTIEYPNAVSLNSFEATQSPKGALLSWNSGGELHNLGFDVYRDVNGQKVKLNPSLIAGSALLMRDTVQQHAAKTYQWIDKSPTAGGLYWLEDVDLNGTRTLHGPISASAATANISLAPRSAMVADLATNSAPQAQDDIAMTAGAAPLARVRETLAHPEPKPSAEIGFKLAAAPATKILVDHEGWYRITQAQLVAAGMKSKVEPRLLHLYAEGVEQPIRITDGEQFGPGSAIEFYGTAIDTPYSGQRVYWLAEGPGEGLRIGQANASGTPTGQAQSFSQTLELKPRTTYFGTLLRENIDDFFGPLVSTTPETETINVPNLAAGDARLSVALQGVTDGQQHTVTVMLNGSTLGDLSFTNQNEGSQELAIPAGTLTEGANTITLLAQGGANDYSLVDTIDLSFPHTFVAENDQLKFTVQAGQGVTVGGFSRPPNRLIDITNPLHPYAVRHEIIAHNGAYALTAVVPGTADGQHTLLALSEVQLANPVALVRHHPSSLHSVQAGAEYVILTAPQFAAELQPLMALHQTEGKSLAMVSVDDVYDEFNFGERTPFAIRTFLETATEAWKKKPHDLLLVGDASVDPRNYLGFGSFDFVPTKIVATAELMTASDDWFSDFKNTGMASIATGRLPARTGDDAQIMVTKTLNYVKGSPSSWNSQAMMVADQDDPTLSFTQESQAVQQLLPQTITATDVFAGILGTSTAQQNLINGINNGKLFVNYNGHGSVEVWSNGGLFNDTAASSLTNGSKLPLFVIMNCLNGFFHDVYTQSMAEALMLAPNGGAVSVWASSGLTAPDPQFAMNKNLAQNLFLNPSLTVGDAVLAAKSSITDLDVRKTFILFGDPALHLQLPMAAVTTPQPKPGGGSPAAGRSSKPGPARPNVYGKPTLGPVD